MKKFLIYIFKWMVATVFIMWICDLAYTFIYKNSHPRDTFRFVLNKQNESLEVVFLGSSKVDNNIDPLLFKTLSGFRTLNLGIQGSTLSDNLLLLKVLLRSNEVKNVYLQVDINFFWTEPTDAVFAQSAPFLADTLVDDFVQRQVKFKSSYYFPFYRYAVFGPKIGFREALFSILNKNSGIDPENNFGRLKGSLQSSSEKKAATDYAGGMQWQPNAVLEEFKKICADNDIRLFLFMAPICELESTENFIKGLRKYVPEIIDLSSGYPPHLFNDCGHLNEKGAEKFTLELYHETIGKGKNRLLSNF
jgi:hypothetical protein